MKFHSRIPVFKSCRRQDIKGEFCKVQSIYSFWDKTWSSEVIKLSKLLVTNACWRCTIFPYEIDKSLHWSFSCCWCMQVVWGVVLLKTTLQLATSSIWRMNDSNYLLVWGFIMDFLTWVWHSYYVSDLKNEQGCL